MTSTNWIRMTEMGEPEGTDRWLVLPVMANPHTWAFVQGKPLPPDQPPAVVRSDTPRCYEDMAWGDGCGTVISTRLRQLFERLAPNHAQFVPCTIQYGERRPRVISQGEYWMTNWLHMVDCFDVAASGYEVEYDRHGLPNYTGCWDPVFNVTRIPSGVRIFRVKGAELTVLVDMEIKEALQAAGITGPQFMTVRTTK